MTALIGAGMFGLVAHPIACLEPYRRDRYEAPPFTEADDPPGCRVREPMAEQQIEPPRRHPEGAGMGGGVQ
jgi:hypothetical protein